ncbi:MAG: crossover junction endodeoxyribonuclease RuvC [Caldilineaceae bacterium]|nr:crossover junction endodeoxyribonuclease RuvC [Caldilineaceae bacterium]MBP8107550.1 crossover junction endodeoxyribonuclease RuvC [Caldilineaceae bacterium]MBP8122472.1 crossover junction endodeoxyribonuclease RuvC [Caldilineaceae bacterium]
MGGSAADLPQSWGPGGREHGRIVLGIDPGTATTGYGVVSESPAGEIRLLACGVIRTAAGDPMHLRLLEIFQDIQGLIREFKPQDLAIEELFFGRNVSTAITVGQARGAALLAAALAGLTVSEYKPAEIKQAITGYGKADKQQMQEMVRQTLDLAEIPRPDDAADGIAIALCHLQRARYQSLIE